MSSAVQNLVVSLVTMQMARKIPLEDPVVLGYVRIAYITAQVVILATYYYVSLAVYLSSKHVSLIWSQIKRKNDQIVLRYIEAAAPMEHGKLMITTFRNYGLSEVSKLVSSPLLPSFQDGWNANNPKQLRSHSVEATASGYQCWTPFERNPGPLTPHPLVDSPILGQDSTVTAVLQAIITFFIFPPSHTLRSSLPRA
ncbi:hypothetical protein AGABI1DRAFT_131652 [Agaricus bisporus var. burnettii JB137-S8]|uniref:Uncharacterized protein n=1 Tax=Agaricus bisporus var. burnettii (strain JB137-S8 / ATCC MYA-4627 / FGSC 10392) TaxID=597362 RepID=K5XNE1_AGABU|nr:uncharacterized protein AGABI1DRAFT_131652 [Agaricus bisporus var. burnettii JB137-S8]EKM76140.1 hypothetical protein AGABI1DRAFT_131652 [Agaricus bisporus var. burnettii JB137-S8]